MFDSWNDRLSDPATCKDWINLETGDFICKDGSGNLLLGKDNAIKNDWESWVTIGQGDYAYGQKTIREIAAASHSNVMMRIPLDGEYAGYAKVLLLNRQSEMEKNPAVWISGDDIAKEYVPTREVVNLLKEACQGAYSDGSLCAFMKTFGDPIYKSPESRPGYSGNDYFDRGGLARWYCYHPKGSTAYGCIKWFLERYQSSEALDHTLADALGLDMFLPQYKDYARECSLRDLVLSMEIAPRHDSYSVDAMEAVCETTVQNEIAFCGESWDGSVPQEDDMFVFQAAIEKVLEALDIPIEAPMHDAFRERMWGEYTENIRPRLVKDNELLISKEERDERYEELRGKASWLLKEIYGEDAEKLFSMADTQHDSQQEEPER